MTQKNYCFELYIFSNLEGESFAGEIVIHAPDGHTIRFLEKPLGRTAVRHLNTREFPGGDMLTHIPKDSLRLTDDGLDILNRFADEVLIPGDLEEAEFLFEDVQMSPLTQAKFTVVEYEDGTRHPAVKYLFSTLYELYSFLFFEMFRMGQKVCRCGHCRNLYFPVSTHKSKFCSARCRQQAHETKSPWYEYYRRRDNTIGTYARRKKMDPEIQKKHEVWQRQALAALHDAEKGLISEERFREILDQHIKDK